MDIRIPGEQGLSLLNVMPNQKDKRVPVIIYSGAVTPEVEKEAFEHGALEVVSKTNNFADLKEKVFRVLLKKEKIYNSSSNEEDFTKPKEKILIVDDEASVTSFLGDFFKKKNYDVILAAEGPQAVSLFDKERPEMVLLDLALTSSMGGMEVLEKIREIDPQAGVVVISGVSDVGVEEQALKLGAYSFVRKPFDVNYLEKVVLTRLILASRV